MAESLNIKITATDSSAAAFASLNRNMTSVSSSFQNLSSTISGFTRGAVGAVLAGSIGEAIGSVVRYADTWTLMQNRLRSAGLTANQTADAQSKIADIASRSRSDIAETANLYARVAFATENMGVKQDDVAKVTETLSKAFKMSGKTALEAQSAVTQFTQALSSGVLQGDELRSLRENAPEVARAIATAFGTTVGGLKQLGAEGALTSDKIFKAVLDAAPQIEARFSTTESTFSDIFTRMGNVAQIVIGKISDYFKGVDPGLFVMSPVLALITKQNPVVIEAMKTQMQAQNELKSAIDATVESQIKLQREQQSSQASKSAAEYNELTKQIWDMKDAAKAAIEELQNRAGYLSEAFMIDPAVFDEGLKLLNTMINSTGEEALRASITLDELAKTYPDFASAISSAREFAKQLQGLQISADSAKETLRQLSREPYTIKINLPELPQPSGLALKSDGSSFLDTGPQENFKKFLENQRTLIYQTKLQVEVQRMINEAKSKGFKDIDEKAITNLAKEKLSHDELATSGKKHADEIENLIQKYREAADPLLVYRQDLEVVEAAFRKGEISAATYAETVGNIKKAMEKAAENADPLKKQTEELTRAFEGFGRRAADAIADFVVDGKGNFSDLIKSMIKDLVSFMIYQNAMKPLFTSLSNGFDLGSLFSSFLGGARASGGSVSSNSPYLVGERGPEIFMPNRTGSIIPNSGIGGGSNVNVNIINNSNSQATTRETTDGRGNRSIDVIIGDVVAKQVGQIGSSVNQSIRNTFNSAPALVGR